MVIGGHDVPENVMQPRPAPTPVPTGAPEPA
jgi:hypothetical protein